MNYIRSQDCECASFVDIQTLPFDQRNTDSYWMNGYIYSPKGSMECSCHKKYRLTQRYNCIAKSVELPTAEELQKLPYLGNQDIPTKVFSLPSIVERNNLNHCILYMCGPIGNQKTTTAAKLMLQLIQQGKSVQYIDFNTLSKNLLDLEYSTTELRTADYLIIDNCFEGEVVNFQATFNAIFDLILKRKNMTILISSKNLEDITFKHYDTTLLDAIKARVNRYKSAIAFTDNAENVLLKEQGPIDIWSL